MWAGLINPSQGNGTITIVCAVFHVTRSLILRVRTVLALPVRAVSTWHGAISLVADDVIAMIYSE